MSDNPYKPKLIFKSEPFAGRVCELTLDRITLGRGEHNMLAIHHPSVSLAHCEILVYGSEVIVRDLQSSNGTFVQGVRLNPQAQVKHGQTVRFGDVTARLELAPPDLEQTTSDETAIHEHAHILRDRKREQITPKAADDSITLRANSPSDVALGDQTVMLTRSKPSAVLTTLEVQPVRERPGAATPTKRLAVILIFALATVVLSFVLWLVFRR